MNEYHLKKDIVDTLFDIFDLFNLLIEVLRNLGDFLSRN